METMNIIILGMASSILASFLFFNFYYIRVKPKISISSQIAHVDNKFKIKILNNDKVEALNVKAELSYLRTDVVPDGGEIKTTKIKLVKNKLFSLDAKPFSNDFTFVVEGGYDIRIRLTENKASKIRMKVIATHPHSNISKVFSKEYSPQQIEPGQFAAGDNLNIVVNRQP